MRIGIDLDGVVFDSELEYRVYTELYDLLELKQNSKIEEREPRFQQRFNWTDEQTKDFFEQYNIKVVKNANFMPGAIEVLKRLKQDGHSLILITARGVVHKEVIDITKERLKEVGLDIFDKEYWKEEEKAKICLKENIDVMIEDYYKNCKKISDEKIKTIYLRDAGLMQLEENEYVKVLYNWGEIYRYIKELENK